MTRRGSIRALRQAERALLIPEGLPNRPWFRHAIYAPGQYTGYAAVVIPGVNEAIDKHDLERTRQQIAVLAAALNRAAKVLEDYSLMTPGNAVAQILKTLPSAAAATFLALFPIVNPFGGVPLFFALTADFPAEERNRTALKTAMYVFGILVVFMFFGRFVLNFFGISLPVLQDCRRTDCGPHRLGHGDGFNPNHSGGERRGRREERHFPDPDGDAHAFRSRLDRRGDGPGGQRRQYDDLPGHGDRDRGSGAQRLSCSCAWEVRWWRGWGRERSPASPESSAF